MASITYPEHIEITPDGKATYRKRLVATGGDDGAQEERERVVEEHCVDAAALLRDGDRFRRLPDGCAFHERAGDVEVFVVEREPTTRVLRMKLEGVAQNYGSPRETLKRLRTRDGLERFGMNEPALEAAVCSTSGERAFSLGLPYTVLVFRFVRDQLDRVYCYFRVCPLATASDSLFRSNLPNVKPNGMVCLDTGSHFALRTDATASAWEQCATAEGQLWMSTWSGILDWHDDHPYYARSVIASCPAQIRSPWEWELSTLEHPLFAVSVPWRSLHRTIGDVVDGLLFGKSAANVASTHADPLEANAPAPSAFQIAVQRIRAHVERMRDATQRKVG